MLIVGLGNPGAKYKDTRHNIGFMAIDHVAEAGGIKLNKEDFYSRWGKGVLCGRDVILAKPQTFMNLSGKAVQGISGYFHIEPKDILVIYDDIDIEFGSLRIRLRGSGGGHRGMESIIEQLGTKDFPRIRMGIGRPEEKESKSQRVKESGNIADYVLNSFDSEEKDMLKQMLDRTKEALDTILKDGIKKAMNRFNKNKEDSCSS